MHTTERGVTGKLFRWMVKHWLKKNHLTYDAILFSEEKGSGVDKLRVCEENDIDVMVDDSPENLYEVGKSKKVLCYDAAWNKECRDLDGCRVKDFGGLYKKMQEINKEIL